MFATQDARKDWESSKSIFTCTETTDDGGLIVIHTHSIGKIISYRMHCVLQ